MRKYINENQVKISEQERERSNQVKLATRNDVIKLEKHLKARLLESDEPTQFDIELFEQLSCHCRVSFSSHLPIILSSEQLAAYEGPMKQLIIGGPGSGKTELLKAKAIQLAHHVEKCKEETKILYIIASGSPSHDPLLSHQMKVFFKGIDPVEVLTITLEEESPESLNNVKAELQRKLDSGKYGHVFIDEYWIGSKPAEHEIILELVANIPGYVWINSVFDYDQERIHSHKKMINRTMPLLTAFNWSVSRLNKIVRGSNNIIELETKYSHLYENRTYPYGTKDMQGHSIAGFPIMWIRANGVDDMYSKCVEVIGRATKESPLPGESASEVTLILNPADIMVADFAVRTKESLSVKPELKERLLNASIPVWSFGDSMEEFMKCDMGKMTLLASKTREKSTYVDGVEWPMVVVILPSVLIKNEAELAEGAERLRNYDTYISFFRAQLKLVVISDKWTNDSEFLADIRARDKWLPFTADS